MTQLAASLVAEAASAIPGDTRRLADLAALLEVSRQLSATLQLEPLLATIGQACRQVLDCERCTIFLYDEHSDELYSRVATGGEPGAVREIRFPAERGIAGEAFRTRVVINVPDAYADSRFNPDVDRKTGYHTRNLLTCPLLGLEGAAVGVLQVLNKNGGSFSRWDEELVQSFGAQAGVALQRQLLLEERAEKQRIQGDLRIARSIQQRLLPSRAPDLPGFELAGWNEPADETGGDLYTFLELPGGKIAIALADVTGHGIGPSLLAAECRALLRACLSLSDQLEEVVARVNTLFCADVPEDRFVTAFVGVVDPAEKICRYISAGQGPLLVYRAADDAMVELRPGGLPLGVFADFPYQLAKPISFNSGDMLILCTDGFTEWPNPTGELFGTARLIDLIRRMHDLPPRELIRALHGAVLSFARGEPQRDDLTALVLKKT